MMNKLCEIANKWGTDKAFENGSGFCILYDEWFNHMIEKEPNILEIGVKAPRGEGNHPSLSMWQEYFQNGKIYGVDLQGDKWPSQNSNISIYQLDQGKRNELENYINSFDDDFNFDLIVDDGSHFWLHQQISLLVLFSKLKPKGQYIIEDLVIDGISGDIIDYYGNTISDNTSKASTIEFLTNKTISPELNLVFSKKEIDNLFLDIDSFSIDKMHDENYMARIIKK